MMTITTEHATGNGPVPGDPAGGSAPTGRRRIPGRGSKEARVSEHATNGSRGKDGATALPRFISVDDHVVEPLDLWQSRLPAKLRAEGPRAVRERGQVVYDITRTLNWVPGDGPDDRWCDVWYYEDTQWPLHASYAAVGPTAGLPASTALSYDDILPGCFEQLDRLADMDLNHTEASLCFPTVTRFCGQLFLDRRDPDLALRCVEAYNDWMIEDWCGGDGRGRLIPLTLVPLWDAVLAAAEVRRCAELGAHAVAFSENPSALGLPSIHTDEWEPFFAACAETETVINMHIGSSSSFSMTSPGAPAIALVALTSENSVHALIDWLLCGALARHPALKIALSESQVGWMPFILERLDSAWRRSASYEPEIYERVPEPPSSYLPGRVFACVFDDLVGLANREQIGMGQIMFETDYPHADSTFPESLAVAESLVAEASLSAEEARRFVRTNAIACYGLERFGISA
jgi:predicted TIM-barrel fold metal-dependent hydrolase